MQEFDYLDTKVKKCDILPQVIDYVEVEDSERFSIALLEKDQNFALTIRSDSYYENINLELGTKSASIKIHPIGGKNFLCIISKLNNFSHIYIYSLENFVLQDSCYCHKMDFLDNKIEIERIFWDSLGTKCKLRYFLEQEKVVREVDDFGFYKNRTKYPELFPVYFFECIKAENFASAKEYVCEELKSVDDDYFANFFADYDFLVLQAKNYYLIGKCGKRIISFELEDNLIQNFSF